jgi:hypothetical protein
MCSAWCKCLDKVQEEGLCLYTAVGYEIKRTRGNWQWLLPPPPNGGKRPKAGMWFLRILKWVEECWWPSVYSLGFQRQLVNAFLLWLASVRVLWARPPRAASDGCLSACPLRAASDGGLSVPVSQVGEAGSRLQQSWTTKYSVIPNIVIYGDLSLRMLDILVWIRIRGSIPLSNGSGFGSGSCYFHHWPSRSQQKTILKKFFCILLFEGKFTSFLKDKKVKRKSQYSRIKVFLTIFAWW